jgi:hypothetical protein
MALFSWQTHFPVERVHPLYSKSLNSLSPRPFIPNSWLGIEWSKDSRSLRDSPPHACLGYWIFIIHTYYSWSFTPRWLEVAIGGEPCEFCITLLCDSELLKGVLVTPWERKGLREIRFFMNPLMRTYDSLWIWTPELNLVSRVLLYLLVLTPVIYLLIDLSCLDLHR